MLLQRHRRHRSEVRPVGSQGVLVAEAAAVESLCTTPWAHHPRFSTRLRLDAAAASRRLAWKASMRA